MRDLVERAELEAVRGRLHLLEEQLQREREARAEADRAQIRWHRLAIARGQAIGQLRAELERLQHASQRGQ